MWVTAALPLGAYSAGGYRKPASNVYPWRAHVQLGDRPLTITAVTLLVLSTALNVAVVVSNHKRTTPSATADAGLKVGDKLESLEVAELSGTLRTIVLDGKHLLFVFSAKCPYCRASVPQWKASVTKSPGTPHLFVSVGPIDEARQFAKDHDIPERDVVVLRASSFPQLKSSAVPQTIFVADRRVVSASVGMARVPVSQTIH
jgi:hypothetical protein